MSFKSRPDLCASSCCPSPLPHDRSYPQQSFLQLRFSCVRLWPSVDSGGDPDDRPTFPPSPDLSLAPPLLPPPFSPSLVLD